jgi:hypothetical protein
LHHVLAALYKLSGETLLVSRQPSFFAVSQLMNSALVNLRSRMMVFWPGLMSHMAELCDAAEPTLREWGVVVVCRLVTDVASIGTDSSGDIEAAARMRTALTSLWQLRHCVHEDVRARLIDCVTRLLHAHTVPAPLWTQIIDVLAAVVNDAGYSSALVKQAYATLTLIVTDFVSQLPTDCVRQLVETDAKFGAQQTDMNISLSAVGQLVSLLAFLLTTVFSGPYLTICTGDNDRAPPVLMWSRQRRRTIVRVFGWSCTHVCRTCASTVVRPCENLHVPRCCKQSPDTARYCVREHGRRACGKCVHLSSMRVAHTLCAGAVSIGRSCCSSDKFSEYGQDHRISGD